MPFHRRGIIVHPEELTLDWLDWMREAKLNTLGLHPVGGVQAHKTLQQAIDEHYLSAGTALRAEANARGIEVEYEAHAMAWLLPRHLFQREPGWFRENRSGERTADFNLCPSNSEALAYVTGRAAVLAALLDTGVSRYFFWLDDVTDCACHCPDCRQLSPSDQQLRTVNAMLTGLRRYNRSAKLCYIAYHDAMDVPRKVQPLDGVFLEYAPIKRDFHRPINDMDSPENVSEARSLRELVAFFGAQDARVLDYWMDNSLYSNWTKPPRLFTLDEEVMKRDAAFYASLGFECVTSFGCYLGPDYRRLYGRPPILRYGEVLGAV